MIKYDLVCEKDHGFEAWFRSSAAFDEQRGAEVLSCPVCGSAKVRKAITAPQVRRTDRGRRAPPAAPRHDGLANTNEKSRAAIKALRQLRHHIRENADYVGKAFSREARRIHYGEAQKRNIYGEASLNDARALNEEGIDVLPMPVLPEDRN